MSVPFRSGPSRSSCTGSGRWILGALSPPNSTVELVCRLRATLLLSSGTGGLVTNPKTAGRVNAAPTRRHARSPSMSEPWQTSAAVCSHTGGVDRQTRVSGRVEQPLIIAAESDQLVSYRECARQVDGIERP